MNQPTSQSDRPTDGQRDTQKDIRRRLKQHQQQQNIYNVLLKSDPSWQFAVRAWVLFPFVWLCFGGGVWYHSDVHVKLHTLWREALLKILRHIILNNPCNNYNNNNNKVNKTTDNSKQRTAIAVTPTTLYVMSFSCEGLTKIQSSQGSVKSESQSLFQSHVMENRTELNRIVMRDKHKQKTTATRTTYMRAYKRSISLKKSVENNAHHTRMEG